MAIPSAKSHLSVARTLPVEDPKPREVQAPPQPLPQKCLTTQGQGTAVAQGGTRVKNYGKPVAAKQDPSAAAVQQKAPPPPKVLPPLLLAPAGAKVPPAGPVAGEKYLVIVESPSKAKTIKGYLASEQDPCYAGCSVLASAGHIRDLPLNPQDRFGIDLNTGAVQFEIPPTKESLIDSLVAAARMADRDGKTIGWNKVYIATDPDREGEAIAWHLATVLQERGVPADKIGRTTWNEVTREGVKNGLNSPRIIDMNMVEAAIYRRVSDRFEGYTESPWLTRKLQPWIAENMGQEGEAPARTQLSAGRVQNATLYLLADRYRERLNHVGRSYGAVSLNIEAGGQSFRSALTKAGGLAVVGPDREGKPGTQMLTAEVMGNLPLPKAGDKLYVISTETKPVRVAPKAPFTTTTMQIAASNGLGLNTEDTMKVAQTLFQNGLITYHRSDSPNVSESAQQMARDHIASTFGKASVPASPRQYKATDGAAQEAHECIRPAHLEPAHAAEQARLLAEAVRIEGPIAEKLLDLITRRFVASQMPDKIHDATVANLGYGSGDKALVFKATGNVTTNDGWTKSFAENEGEEATGREGRAAVLPALVKGGAVLVQKATTTMKATTPSPAYTEATLVEGMGKESIGRPATVPATLKTLVTRGYMTVANDGARKNVVTLTPLGLKAFETLEQELPDEVKPAHTAQLENQLHQIAAGKLQSEAFLNRVYSGLRTHFPYI